VKYARILGYARNGRPIYSIAGGSGDEPPPADKDNGDGPPEGYVPAEELERVRTRMQAADRRAEDNATQLREREDELRAARVELAVRREVAARREGRFEDVEVVLPLVRDAIETNDDGEPVEVSATLDALAVRHTYLLSDNAPPDRADPTKAGPTGGPVGSRTKQGSTGVQRQEARSQVPGADLQTSPAALMDWASRPFCHARVQSPAWFTPYSACSRV
jgi:hypothetical protein